MLDSYGRSINYLRISITDRCNLRCAYCMPDDGITWLPHEDILSNEEILRLCKIFAKFGVKKMRLTGGEPLVRKGLPQMIEQIKTIDGIESVSLTTNGVLLAQQLPDLLSAGLDGVNLSLDTLDREQFHAITRRDLLGDTLAGLQAAIQVADRLNVKVNCVPMGDNDKQLVPLAQLAKDNPIAVRFIEMMPIGLGSSQARRTQDEVTAMLEKVFGPIQSCDRAVGAGPSQYVTFQEFQGKIGFISAMTHKFCSDCNRVRLTATGFLKTCLQYDIGEDLRSILRSSQDDTLLEEAITHAILNKPVAHHFAEENTQQDENRKMFQIGG